jgi:putative ABC transporter, ATP-binding subunit
MTLLSAQNITKSYGSIRAVDAMDLEIYAGEIVVILGHNGSGKTTFIECIEGLRRPDAGTVRIFGQPHSYGARTPTGMGVQLQEEQLPPRIKVKEALWLYTRIHSVDAPPVDLMEAMALTSLLNKKFDSLSSGQKRRVNLVLAFMGAPQLVVLDEPTAGLDPQARAALVEVLKRRRQDGLSVLTTLHEVDYAAALGDRVIIMAHGQIRRQGTVDELLASIGTDACLSLPAGTDRRPWKKVGTIENGPEGTLVIFGMRSKLQAAQEQLPGGLRGTLRPVDLGDVVTQAAQVSPVSVEDR